MYSCAIGTHSSYEKLSSNYLREFDDNKSSIYGFYD